MYCSAKHTDKVGAEYMAHGMGLCTTHFETLLDTSGSMKVHYALRDALQALRLGGTDNLNADMKRRRTLVKDPGGHRGNPRK